MNTRLIFHAFVLFTLFFTQAFPHNASDLALQIADLQKRLSDLEQKAAKEIYVEKLRQNSSVKVKLSGHLNRAAVVYNDRKQSKLFHVDNNNSSSRMALNGEAKINDDLALNTLIEIQLKDNASDDVSFTRVEGATSPVIALRKMDVQFHHKKYGSLHFGKGNVPTTNSAASDLSGTFVLTAGSAMQDLAGEFRFRRKNSDLEGPRLKTIFGNYGGGGRNHRIKYVTQNFYGFNVPFGDVKSLAL